MVLTKQNSCASKSAIETKTKALGLDATYWQRNRYPLHMPTFPAEIIKSEYLMNRKVKLNRAVAWVRLKCNTPAVSSPRVRNSRHPVAPCPDLHSTVNRALYRVMHTSHGYNSASIPFSIIYFRGTENIKIIEKVYWNNHTVG